MFRGFLSSVFMEITMISNSRSEHASSSGLIEDTLGRFHEQT